MNTFLGILIPFAGTTLGAACVFFLKNEIKPLVQKMLLGFSVACILGSVIHGIRMKWTGCGKRLAFGPYLAAGIIFAMTMGNRVINWYGQFY